MKFSLFPIPVTSYIMTTFSDLIVDLGNVPHERKDMLTKYLNKTGINFTTKVQKDSITAFMEGNDIIAQAPCSEGKTYSYMICMLLSIDTSLVGPQYIVLLNTKILSHQVKLRFDDMIKYCNMKINTTVIHGSDGRPEEQLSKIENSSIVFGTVARLKDILTRDEQRGARILKNIKGIIVDEFDEQLNDIQISKKIENKHAQASKHEAIEEFVQYLAEINECIHVSMYSATVTQVGYNRACAMVAEGYKEIVSNKNGSKNRITQYYHYGGSMLKSVKVIGKIISELREINRALIFCNSYSDCIECTKLLKRQCFSIQASIEMIGDRDETIENRMTKLEEFRKGNIKYLISTDVLSRGIDIVDVNCVFLVSLPKNEGDFINQIGRTGRNCKGIAISIFPCDETENNMNDDRKQMINMLKVNSEKLSSFDNLRKSLNEYK